MSDNHEDPTTTHKPSRNRGLIAYLYGRPLAMLAHLAEMQARRIAEFNTARKGYYHDGLDRLVRKGEVAKRHRSSNCFTGVENGAREVARRCRQLERGLLSPVTYFERVPGLPARAHTLRAAA